MMIVDAMGKACPTPVIMTKKAMDQLNGEEQIEVLVDNEVAMKNVSKMGVSQGGLVEAVQLGTDAYKVTITMGGDLENKDHKEDKKEPVNLEKEEMQSENTVLVFSSDLMGSGNDELGKVLMKGYIYAITQLDVLPTTMLFYNGGATLTAEGSDSIEDLQHLLDEGVEIFTCGTCLNYYGLSDKLLVGEVTNMYVIAEKMALASKIIRP